VPHQIYTGAHRELATKQIYFLRLEEKGSMISRGMRWCQVGRIRNAPNFSSDHFDSPAARS